MEVSENLSEKAVYDLKLVRRAVDNNDQKAYAELMSRYRDSIYFMLLKMINNKDDAEDLTIEAFGKAFKRLHQYTPNYAFRRGSSRSRPTTASTGSASRRRR